MSSLVSRFRLWTVLAALLIIAGCTAEGQKENVAKVRFFNAVHDSSALRIQFEEDGDVVSQLGAGTLVFYRDVKTDEQEYKVFSAAGTQLFESSSRFNEESKQLFIVAGTLGSYLSYLVDDDYDEPDDGKTLIRMLHAAAGVTTMDVYITASSENINQVNPTLNNVGYRSGGAFTTMNAGTYRLQLTTAGTKDVIYESDTFTLSSKKATSFLIHPTGSSKLAAVTRLEHDDSGSGAVLASRISRFKSANGVDGVTYNVQVDGQLVQAGIPLSGLSSYQFVRSGNRQLRIEPSNTPGTALISSTINFEPSKEYTLIATGSGTSASLVAVPDSTQEINSGKVRLRVINAVGGGAPVNLSIDFTSQASNVPSSSASKYIELNTGKYNITVTSASSGATLFSTTNYEFDSDDVGKMFAVILTRSGNTITGSLVSDN